MAEPQLNCSRGDAVGVVHRGKRLAEPMQNPMLTARRILAGNRLAIERARAMTTVEPSRQGPLLQHPEEVSFGIPRGVGKNQPAIRMHRLAHLEQFYERIRNRYRALFLVLRVPVPLPFLQHTDGLQFEVNVGVAGMGDFVLAKSCTKKELPN